MVMPMAMLMVMPMIMMRMVMHEKKCCSPGPGEPGVKNAITRIFVGWCTYCKRKRNYYQNCTLIFNMGCRCPEGYIYELAQAMLENNKCNTRAC